MQWIKQSISVLALALMACGGSSGGGGITPPIAMPPPPPPPASPDFTQVQAEVDRFSVADMAILIGDETGVLFRYEKGSFTSSDIVNIASATKLITGLGVWSLIEDGQLSETDNPQDYIAGWTGETTDSRTKITLSQLLSFTSGFNDSPAGYGCQGDENFTLRACVTLSYIGGVDTVPGEAFSYGPEHMQIAALMAREKTGTDLKDTIRSEIFDPLGVRAVMGFDPGLGDNPRYSGGMLGSADDYAKILTAILSGNLVSDRAALLRDRTTGTSTAYLLPALENTMLDWHYGFGFWIECDSVPFQASCNEQPTISSPGAFGFLPWVDFKEGYWAILAMREPIGIGQSPSTKSVELEQILQPMIAAQLD